MDALSTRYLALDANGGPAVYGTLRGAYHVITLPAPQIDGTDVLPFAEDGKLTGACGRSFKADNARFIDGNRPTCKGCKRFVADKAEVSSQRNRTRLAVSDREDAARERLAKAAERQAQRAEKGAEREDAVKAERARIDRAERKRVRRAAEVKAEREAARVKREDAIKAEREGRAARTASPGPTERAKREAAAAAERMRAEREAAERAERAPEKVASKAEQRKRAARRDSEARAIARVTDGKCAVLIIDPDSTERAEMLLPVRGRLAPKYGAAIVAAAPSVELLPVGKNAVAIKARPGTDTDGVHGVCPFCWERVALTGSGAIGTHRIGGVTPDGPQLSERVTEAVDRNGGTARDSAKRRKAEGESGVRVAGTTRGGKSRRVEQVVTHRAENAGAAVGIRDHGRSDGPALVPLGETGYAGMKFDDERKLGAMANVGGAFGWLSSREYGELSRTQQRRYDRKVHKLAGQARAARKQQRERDIAAGRLLPSEVRRNARQDAATGRSDDGHTLSHYGKAPATADSADASIAAAGVKNNGKRAAKSPRK